MLTQKDWKLLRYTTSAQYRRLAPVSFLAGGIVMFLVAGIHVWLLLRLAHAAQMPVGQIYTLWNEHAQVGALYSGAAVEAMKHLTIAPCEASLGIIMLGLAYGTRRRVQFFERLLAALDASRPAAANEPGA